MAHHASPHPAHGNDDHHHDAHHGPRGTARGDALKVGSVLVLLFLGSMAAHYLFAKEVLYDWSQNRQNAQAAQDIQPNAGEDR